MFDDSILTIVWLHSVHKRFSKYQHPGDVFPNNLFYAANLNNFHKSQHDAVPTLNIILTMLSWPPPSHIPVSSLPQESDVIITMGECGGSGVDGCAGLPLRVVCVVGCRAAVGGQPAAPHGRYIKVIPKL